MDEPLPGWRERVENVEATFARTLERLAPITRAMSREPGTSERLPVPDLLAP